MNWDNMNWDSMNPKVSLMSWCFIIFHHFYMVNMDMIGHVLSVS